MEALGNFRYVVKKEKTKLIERLSSKSVFLEYLKNKWNGASPNYSNPDPIK